MSGGGLPWRVTAGGKLCSALRLESFLEPDTVGVEPDFPLGTTCLRKVGGAWEGPTGL